MKVTKKIYFLFILILIIFLITISSYNKNIFLKSTSPNKENKIILRIKEPKFSFGSTPIFITSKKTTLFSFDSVKYETYISNDGKKIYHDDDNITVSWIDSNTAIITLKGEEQSDKNIKVIFDKEITYEEL